MKTNQETHQETTLNFRAFDPKFKTGLLFTLFEGLRNGEGFYFVCDQNPDDLKAEFDRAQIQNSKWEIRQHEKDKWEVHLHKMKSGHHSDHSAGGCCGICGGTTGELEE